MALGSETAAFFGAAGAAASGGGYTIDRSLRFNSADSAYLNRTPGSAGNRKTWTWAAWVKRGPSSVTQTLFKCGETYIQYYSTSNTLYTNLRSGATNYFINYANVFRDPSAWYHIVVAVDTTQAASADRQKVYVNGVQLTDAGGLGLNYPPQNTDTAINDTTIHYIGGTLYFDGYLADIHFIDGQALDPTSFGEFDADTGVWNPIAYTGSYGTNGFHLDFSDNSTAAALGTDTSGNGNTWTVNNISVAAGAGNDSLVDVPTNGTETDTGVGGEVRGNYAVLNPLSTAQTLSNGNLEATLAAQYSALSTIAFPLSGKWYCEFVLTAGTGGAIVGITPATTGASINVPDLANSYGYINTNGNKRIASVDSAYGSTYTLNDIIGISYDADSNSLVFYKNGASQGAISVSAVSYVTYVFAGAGSSGIKWIANFGQRPFAYTAPSGFKALCTANLGDPVVTKPSEYMDVVTYLGNGSTQVITTGFSPDFIWLKDRGQARSHRLIDTVRGIQYQLFSDTTDGGNTYDASSYVSSVTATSSTGFTVDGTGTDAYNELNKSYVAWTWDAGSSTVTNTDGSITSSVRANATAGFSIVSFNSGSAGNYTVGHGLGAKPHLIIAKARNGSTFNWSINHISIATTVNKYLTFTTNGTLDNGAAAWGASLSDTNSTTFGISSANAVEASKDCIAYCFAPVAGYSSFGSYTGNGSSDGPFVYTGFRPRWILTKETTSTNSWTINDAARDPYNAAKSNLWANLSNSEDTSTAGLDILSNGFKPRTSANYNNSGQTYIYAAFAEHPFQFSRAR